VGRLVDAGAHHLLGGAHGDGRDVGPHLGHGPFTGGLDVGFGLSPSLGDLGLDGRKPFLADGFRGCPGLLDDARCLSVGLGDTAVIGRS